MALRQDGRIGTLTTPLPSDGNGDPLVLVRFNGSEGLSELFTYTVDALSLDPNIDFNKALGQACTVKIKTSGPERMFNGILTAAQSLGPTQLNDAFSYRLTLRPWLWLLTRTNDCRIFQEKTAPDIIREVFRDRHFYDFESQLQGETDFPTLEYCVQYRETDFNFVSRLMEKEGIYYYFKHTDGKHTLVLANAPTSHDPIPQHETMPFNRAGTRLMHREEYIVDWTTQRQVRSGVFELNDYNYETPNTRMSALELGAESYTRSEMELYDYPGNYKDPEVGARYAEIALQAEQAQDHRRFGSGNAISLFPGGLTGLSGHEVGTENTQYLVVRALHSYGTQGYRSQQTGNEIVQGNYEFHPSDRPFRAPIVTPKPRIYGVQTAKVVTKVANRKQEIDVEKLSEIYVQFYWDRGRHEEKRSCKVRCAQVWAGKNWGGQFIPRVGMEVVVEFLEGDPDRPLVIGCVYNDDNQPPWDLPSEKTVSGIKSDSTLGSEGYNSWSFEDKKGAEQINVHAQLDLNTMVNNNETRHTGNDLDTTIIHAETRTIGKDFEMSTGNPARLTTIKKGDDELHVESGQILHSAMLKIVLTVQGSSLTIDPTGITLEAPTISLRSPGVISINGSLVKIN